MTDEQRARLEKITKRFIEDSDDYAYYETCDEIEDMEEAIRWLVQLVEEQERKTEEMMDTVFSAFPSLKLKYERER